MRKVKLTIMTITLAIFSMSCEKSKVDECTVLGNEADALSAQSDADNLLYLNGSITYVEYTDGFAVYKSKKNEYDTIDCDCVLGIECED